MDKTKFDKVYADLKALRDALGGLERSVEAMQGEFRQIEKLLEERRTALARVQELQDKLNKIGVLFHGSGNA